MDQQKNSFENPDERMTNFKDEIRLIMEKEREDQKTAHFRELNPEELLPEDLEIWEKVKNNSVTRDDLEAYKSNFIDNVTMRANEEIPESRKEFFAFVANKAGIVFLKKAMKKE